MNFRHVLLALACLCTAVGCGKDDAPSSASSAPANSKVGTSAAVQGQAKHTLVGTWSMPAAPGNTSTFVFKGDGTFENEMTETGPQGQKATTTTSGTYNLTGEKFGMVVKDIKISSPDPKLAPQIKAQEAQIKQQISQIPPMNGTLKFTAADSAELKMDVLAGAPAGTEATVVTLKRKA